MRIERHFLPTSTPPRSLCWSGDALVDWVQGGRRHALSGGCVDPHRRYASSFDAAVASPDGRYAVLHERLGTRGLVLRDGEPVRELRRDCYHADVYEYPVALWTSPRGRTLLAHCPEDYCRIELEDAETGKRLTPRDGPPKDHFHSRLRFSPDGRSLLSAGWVWHPVEAAWVFDVTRALEQPSALDEPADFCMWDEFGEVHAASFGPVRGTVLLECDHASEDAPDAPHLVTCSVNPPRVLSRVPLECFAGDLMLVDARHAVGFHGHPTLIELETGRVVKSWPELNTGSRYGSITHHLPPPAPLAWDAAGRRFAVGTEQGIEVVLFFPES